MCLISYFGLGEAQWKREDCQFPLDQSNFSHFLVGIEGELNLERNLFVQEVILSLAGRRPHHIRHSVTILLTVTGTIPTSSTSSDPSFCSTSMNTIAVRPASWPDNDKPNAVSIPPPRLPCTSRAYNSRIFKMNRGVRVKMGTVCRMGSNISCHPPVGKYAEKLNTSIRAKSKILRRKVAIRSVGVFRARMAAKKIEERRK